MTRSSLIAIDLDIRYARTAGASSAASSYVASHGTRCSFLAGSRRSSMACCSPSRMASTASFAGPAAVEASAQLSKELYLFRTCTLHYADARFNQRSVLADRLRRIDADLTSGGGKEVAMVGPAKRHDAPTTGSRTRPRAPRCSQLHPEDDQRSGPRARTSTSSSAPSGRRRRFQAAIRKEARWLRALQARASLLRSTGSLRSSTRRRGRGFVSTLVDSPTARPRALAVRELRGGGHPRQHRGHLDAAARRVVARARRRRADPRSRDVASVIDPGSARGPVWCRASAHAQLRQGRRGGSFADAAAPARRRRSKAS